MSDSSRGKKRAAAHLAPSDDASASVASTSGAKQPPAKRSKKGITKPCPVCKDAIPVRLLESHAAFELERLEDMAKVLPDDVELPADGDDGTNTPGAGPSTSRRASSLRARKSITSFPYPSGTAPSSPSSSLTAEASKTISLLKRHRRTRHSQIRSFSKAVLSDLDDTPSRSKRVRVIHEQECPVCEAVITVVDGGESMDEHVNRCITERAAVISEELAFDLEMGDGDMRDVGEGETYEMNGETRLRTTSLTRFAGTGFNVRDARLHDVEDDLDIEGGDEELYGEAQFDEGDILDVAVSESGHSEVDGAGRTLHDLVARGRIAGEGKSEAKDEAAARIEPEADAGALINVLKQNLRYLAKGPLMPGTGHAVASSIPLAEDTSEARRRFHEGKLGENVAAALAAISDSDEETLGVPPFTSSESQPATRADPGVAEEALAARDCIVPETGPGILTGTSKGKEKEKISDATESALMDILKQNLRYLEHDPGSDAPQTYEGRVERLKLRKEVGRPVSSSALFPSSAGKGKGKGKGKISMNEGEEDHVHSRTCSHWPIRLPADDVASSSSDLGSSSAVAVATPATPAGEPASAEKSDIEAYMGALADVLKQNIRVLSTMSTRPAHLRERALVLPAHIPVPPNTLHPSQRHLSTSAPPFTTFAPPPPPPPPTLNPVPPSQTCQICLEPYVDPTTSIACWHVFCSSCWLKSLARSSFCPICKSISMPGGLRRVYL